MTAWTPCPDTCLARFDRDSLQRHWSQLHLGDAQPWPTDPALLDGWRLYHEGAFEAAATVGLAQGLAVRFGRNVRPTPRLAELELPAWFAGAFGAALVLSLLSGAAGQIGAGLAVIAGMAYLLHGLGVVHWWAARARSPGLVLAWVYLLVGIFTPVAAALVVLGLVDTWARFRHRGTRTGTEE